MSINLDRPSLLKNLFSQRDYGKYMEIIQKESSKYMYKSLLKLKFSLFCGTVQIFVSVLFSIYFSTFSFLCAHIISNFPATIVAIFCHVKIL